MNFALPIGLLALSSIIPLIILYLIRPRPKQLGIPSLMFFIKTAGTTKITSFFRNITRDWLFLIQLGTLLMLSFAVAKPFLEVTKDITAENIVLVLDASASMKTQETGATRFEIMRQKAKTMLAKRNTVIIAKDLPHIGIKNEDSLSTEQYLNTINPSDTPTKLGDAILLAGETLAKGRVIVISDFINTGGQDPETAKNVLKAKGLVVDFINVGTKERRNVGITELSFGEGITATIKNTGVQKEARTLIAGKTQKQFVLEPEETGVFSFSDPEGILKLELSGKDDFPGDDIAYIAGPSRKNISVLMITNNKSIFLESALKATGIANLEIAEPPIVPQQDYDVYLLHNINQNELLPGTLEEIKQKAEKGKFVIIHAQKDTENFDYKGLHTIEFDGFLDKSKIIVQQLSEFTKDIDFGFLETVLKAKTKNAEVFATAQGIPVIAIAPLKQGSVMYYGLVEESSDFKFAPDYPIFWNNLLRVISNYKDASRLTLRTGQQIIAEKQTKITTPKGVIQAKTIPLDEAGIYTVDNIQYGVSLLNEFESSISAVGTGQKSTEYVLNTVKETKKLELDTGLMSLAIILILFEIFYIKARGDI
ncbi:VWA domain-containing protein [Candidatus Woesearchaeota archaeon]|nr:VWA domain-containing protein [Candidatus Woesearchaeota archaeon]